jgi:hypothetical protein
MLECNANLNLNMLFVVKSMQRGGLVCCFYCLC